MGENKMITEDNIRFTLGIMDYETVNTEKTFNNGLKNEDPVVIIHRDDFLEILNSNVPGIWLKFNTIKNVMSYW